MVARLYSAPRRHHGPWERSVYYNVRLLPYTGSVKALIYISEFAIGGKTTLERAKLARALCMVVPLSVEFGSLGPFSPDCFNIHGQHPIPVLRFSNPFSRSYWSSSNSRGRHSIIGHHTRRDDLIVATVPPSFKVQPILDESQYDYEIASNYSILKTFAAIVQIVYGCYELYEARGTQINAFGYAAYSLTVIPYVFMSFLNLIASMCRPSYPSRYLVYYRGPYEGCQKSWEEKEALESLETEVAGAVGYAYGLSCEGGYPDITSTDSIPINVLIFFLLLAPYILIYFLTGYNQGHSTVTQRTWLMCSLVLGQLFTLVAQHLIYPIQRWFFRCLNCSLDDNVVYAGISVILSAPTVGAFVQVAYMIFQDDVCRKI
ncbi:uncharacterized protein H6S33_003719 [Morchella sextelata]|uniref:uncharacterized protein n=1 Tax=Morchella sextelata TaxID=1174677 RepID=UPI001D04BAD0|nr:uncharacterized protein H6S33_003719 [Morchella sextelata]KAH0606885.1 hypothetical protein H6S33_003719 [Morchella sextelata]